jgi:hypothetical protein
VLDEEVNTNQTRKDVTSCTNSLEITEKMKDKKATGDGEVLQDILKL